MKHTWASLSGLVSAAMNDDAVLLSVSSSRESLGGETGLSSLLEFAREGSPRKAQLLLQQFAKNTLEKTEEVDDVTKQKLKEIGAQLTNNTWMALEQAHRRDQDNLDRHWRAIKECGEKHIAHLQQDVDGFEVQQVRTHEADMIKCRGLPNHTNPNAIGLLQGPYRGHVGVDQVTAKGNKINYDAPDTDLPSDYNTVGWLDDTPFAIYKDENGNHQRYFKHVSNMYNEEGGKYYGRSLLHIKYKVCDACGALDAFLEGIQNDPAMRPNCEPTLVKGVVDPQATTEKETYIESDLDQWFNNLVEYSNLNLPKWTAMKEACDAAREEYKEVDEHCDLEQQQYEESFCSYRMGLHSTCAEYQGCHILKEEEYKDLISDVLYAADSRKIDWKAIHKIACYIKVLISDGSNQDRTYALENCESGDLNTLATILTGFNETNYLSIIIPEISGNVSCWDMDVPPLIDFKECDMTSVSQYPCTDTWMERYHGLESPTACVQCPTLPDHMQYSDNDYQDTSHARLEKYGGGWVFVNELGKSETDINDLTELQPSGYHLPSYNMKNLKYNDVLIQRVSANWCDSWGRQSSKWVEEDGASMCVQADNDHVYCMSNHGNNHSWRQQPTSHFAALCGDNHGVVSHTGIKPPGCACWPWTDGIENICFAHDSDSPKARENVPAPRHVEIKSLEADGSVVRVTFHGEEKKDVLRVANYGSFLDGVGCGASTNVQYRVYVRCLGCVTERPDFHTKDGAQFTTRMQMGHPGDMEIAFKSDQDSDKYPRDDYTYEAWFRSPLSGRHPRELFGGVSSGLVLVNQDHLADHGGCEYGEGSTDATTYHLHDLATNVYSKVCFKKDLMYHVAVVKHEGHIRIYVNGEESSFRTSYGDVKISSLTRSFGGGFSGDGGQLFNVRIWRRAVDLPSLKADAAVTDPEKLSSKEGLVHFWPLTENIQDVITGDPLACADEEEECLVRYAPVWCSDLEATGMRVC